MNPPFLYALYQSLARDQALLGTSLHEYYALLELVASGRYPIRSFGELQFVLESLWAKSLEQRGMLRELMGARRLAIEEWLKALETAQVDVASQRGEVEDGQRGTTESASREAGQIDTKDALAPPPAPLRDAPAPSEDKRAIERQQPAAMGFSISREQLPQGVLLKLRHGETPPTPMNRSPFHFGNAYHPVAGRQLQQAWRTLKHNRPGVLSSEVDIARTVAQTAKQGYFSTLRYVRHVDNHVRLILLLDGGANMVAVESFGDELFNAARDSKRHADLRAGYFQRLPRWDNVDGDYVFSNAIGTAKIRLCDMVKGMNKKDIAVLIYSDAGALGFEYDEQRRQEWLDVLDALRTRTGYVAWVNPAPKHRWAASTASGLAARVSMFEADRTGIEQAIATLRGKPMLTP